MIAVAYIWTASALILAVLAVASVAHTPRAA